VFALPLLVRRQRRRLDLGLLVLAALQQLCSRWYVGSIRSINNIQGTTASFPARSTPA
jgi:hypothetical protein